MTKLLIFDWDGTLIDSVQGIVECLDLSLQAEGIDHLTRDELKDVIGLGLIEAFRKLLPDFDEPQIERLKQGYRERYLSGQLSVSRLFSGVLENLTRFKEQGYTLAIATGKGRAGLDKAMSETECSHLFELSRCADETTSKPDPHMLYEIMQETGFSRSETLMIGDTEYDIEMANRAEVRSIAVSYGVHDFHRLNSRQPVAVIDKFSDLQFWIK